MKMGDYMFIGGWSILFGIFIFSFLYSIYKIVNKEKGSILWIIITSVVAMFLFNIVYVINGL